MVFKLSQKDFELIDAVLDDYAKKGKTDKICPYCGTPIKKRLLEWVILLDAKHKTVYRKLVEEYDKKSIRWLHTNLKGYAGLMLCTLDGEIFRHPAHL